MWFSKNLSDLSFSTLITIVQGAARMHTGPEVAGCRSSFTFLSLPFTFSFLFYTFQVFHLSYCMSLMLCCGTWWGRSCLVLSFCTVYQLGQVCLFSFWHACLFCKHFLHCRPVVVTFSDFKDREEV